MTLEHLLNCEEIKSIEDTTSKYWEARSRMTLLLNPEHYTHTHTLGLIAGSGSRRGGSFMGEETGVYKELMDY